MQIKNIFTYLTTHERYLEKKTCQFKIKHIQKEKKIAKDRTAKRSTDKTGSVILKSDEHILTA